MNIPKGYKLVPVEPTEEMLEVLHSNVKILVDTFERTADIINDKEWWASVVEAAPTPPQPIYDEAKRTAELEQALAGMLFAFDDGVGRDWSEGLLDFARKLTPAVEFQSRAKAGEVSP